METIQAIMSRKSTRAFKEKQIGDKDLETILLAAMAAPVGSAAYDSLHLTVVQKQSVFQEISDAVTQLILKMTGKKMDKNFGAPTMIFVSSKPTMMPGLEYANAACVIENMAIAATDLGIDNIVWAAASVAVAQNSNLLKELEIPEGFVPVLCISLGYSVEDKAPKKHVIKINKVS